MREVISLKNIFFLLSTFALLAIAVTVLANTTSYFDKDAATVFPIENINIVMKKEIVKIEPYVDQWQARCEFIFYNKGDSEEIVTMGYPDWVNDLFNGGQSKEFWSFFDSLPKKTKDQAKEAFNLFGFGYRDIYKDGYKEGKIPYVESAWNLQDLDVLLDGMKVTTKHKAIIEAKNLPGDGAFIWEVKFKPHEIRTVKVSFTFSGFNESSDISYARYIYILRTGALWADQIGVADIYWDITGRDVNLKQIVPHNYRIDKNIIHWHFENFKPTEDIVITSGENAYQKWNDTITAVANIYRTKALYEGNSRLYSEYDVNEKGIDPGLHRLYVKSLRNEIYARHGRIFTTPEMKAIFGSAPWYKPRQEFSESELNEIEKKNVEYISTFEMKRGWK